MPSLDSYMTSYEELHPDCLLFFPCKIVSIIQLHLQQTEKSIIKWKLQTVTFYVLLLYLNPNTLNDQNVTMLQLNKAETVKHIVELITIWNNIRFHFACYLFASLSS